MKHAPAARRRHGRLTIAAILALFIVGLVVAFLLVAGGWRIGAARNYGELVVPIRPIDDVTLVDSQGRPVRFSSLKGRWTLLYFGSAECLKPCTDNLYKMRQITAAQGREAHRLQQVFIVTEARARDLLRYMLADYPATAVWFGPPAAINAVARQFGVTAGTPLDGLHRVYVIDPLGNFMMSYPADADMRRMNKDIRLLLRASHIG